MSTLVLASEADFLPAFLADLDAAFFFPLAPATLGAAACSVLFLRASAPFSCLKRSWFLMTAVLPSLKVKSANSSSPFFPAPPLRETTPFSSTLAFLPPSAVETFWISGRVSCLELFEMDF